MVAATYIERLEAVIACFSFSSVFQRYIQGDKKSILAIKFTKDNGRAYYQIFQIIKSATRNLALYTNHGKIVTFCLRIIIWNVFRTCMYFKLIYVAGNCLNDNSFIKDTFFICLIYSFHVSSNIRKMRAAAFEIGFHI